MNHPLPAAKKSSGPFLDNNQPSKSDPPRVAGPRDPAAIDRLRKAAAVLFGAALGIAVYLAWQSAAGKVMPGCSPESGCGQILNSRWSVAAGIPVSLLGAVVYAAMLFSSLRPGLPQWQRRAEWGASGLVLGGAFWFTIVQAFILHAFCPWGTLAGQPENPASLLRPP
jgi:uncharacterized membrane protein